MASAPINIKARLTKFLANQAIKLRKSILEVQIAETLY